MNRTIASYHFSFKIFVIIALLGMLFAGGLLVSTHQKVGAAGGLTVEIIASPNLVVDSNVLSPSTQAPQVATVIGKICNTNNSALTNVSAAIGNYLSPGPSTPGIYPAKTNPTLGGLTYQGTYQFTHLGGAADALRTIGTLAANTCVHQYWSFTYPRTAINASGGATIPAWGTSVKPDDDLKLDFDIWAVSDAGGAENKTATMTFRNEISAMANKIKPNGNPAGEWFTTDFSTVLPGQTITTNGINYRLGNVGKGFDNNNDGAYDFNAWLQPFGNPGYDPSCFRLVGVTGTLTIERSGGITQVIPFVDNLYFTDLPQDNTNVTGLVYYKFMALGGPCTISISPYQEVASGADNEKFNGDYGSGIPPLQTGTAMVILNKTGPTTSAPGTITYEMPFYNDSLTASAGLTLSVGGLDMPLSLRDTVPAGLQYQCGSAAATLDFSPNTGVTIFYSKDSGSTWSTSEATLGCPTNPTSTAPAGLVMLRWNLNDPLPKKPGSGANTSAGKATFQAVIPGAYVAGSGPVIENCASSGFGDAAAFAQKCITTLVTGNNRLGDFAWKDLDGDGVQDGGLETGLQNVTVKLYYDRGILGVYESGTDLLVDTTTTDANGAYFFGSTTANAGLPNGNYLVTIDSLSSGIPTGYNLSTGQYQAVTLTGGSNILTADFGFAPTLRIDKTLTSLDPAVVGETVSYKINLTNQRPGDGTASGFCRYTLWAGTVPASGPPASGIGNAAFANQIGAAGAPDGVFAVGSLANNSNSLGLGGFTTGGKTGTITKVEVLQYFRELKTLKPGDDIGLAVFYNNAQTGALISHTGLATFTGPAGTDYVIADNITTYRGSWLWTDFAADLVEFQVQGNKDTGAAGGDIGLDALGVRITTNQICASTADTITVLPLEDTYDSAKLQFLSAVPAPDITTPAGTLKWSNLGPLYAGGTQSVTVNFKALATTTTATVNTASVTAANRARFANGRDVNDTNLSDTASVNINASGSIAGVIFADSNISGWNAASPFGYNTGDTFFANTKVQLYACVSNTTGQILTSTTAGAAQKDCTDVANNSTWTLMQTLATDSSGAYSFTGLRDGYYNVKVLETSLPAGFNLPVSRRAEASPAGNGAGTTCGTCDGQWNTDAANLNTFNELVNGASGENVTAVSFGYLDDGSNQGAVTGYVYSDNGTGNNNNGTFNANETGINGVTVYLCAATGDCSATTNLAATTTNAAGFYSFGNLAPGSFRIFVNSSGLGMTQSGDPDVPGAACSGAACDNLASSFAIAANTIAGPKNFGYTGGLMIGDSVYADWNGDGTQNAGEEGLPNVPVTLYTDINGDGLITAGEDTLLASAITNSSGSYSFTNLPGNGSKYTVWVGTSAIPGGYTQTGDPDQPGAACSTCDAKASVTLTTTSILTVDFGYQPRGSGVLGDTVWLDSNPNGVQSASENGISGVTVALYEDNNQNGIIDGTDALIGTTTTDASGKYLFSNLFTGSGAVAQGYIVSLPAGNFSSGALSNAQYRTNGATTSASVLLTSAAPSNLTADFGYTASGIGDYVWNDFNADGVQDAGEPGINGVTLSLYTDSNNDGVPDGAAIQTTTTANNSLGKPGYYRFNNLGPDNYIVRLNPENFLSGGALFGATQTGDPDSANPLCVGAECDNQSRLKEYTAPDSTVYKGLLIGQNDLTRDFGYKLPLATLGDQLWIDSNANNVFDAAAETPLAFVTVRLCGDAACTSILQTTLTDAGGKYLFGGLSAGTYYVSVLSTDPELLAKNVTNTYARDGSADNRADLIVVSDPGSGLQVTAVNGTACSNCGLELDFGYRPTDNGRSISGTAWYDTDSGGQVNGTGDIDPAETYRYQGLAVNLIHCGVDATCGTADDWLVTSTTTDASGQYNFSSLSNGTYRVSLGSTVSLLGNSLTTPAVYNTVTLNAGSPTARRDFGLLSNLDFGDLPSTYNLTLLGAEGPRHTLSGLLLGTGVSAEPNGTESALANADSMDDGVTQAGTGPAWVVGSNGGKVNLKVAGCTGTCYVSAWIDWNNDGDFGDAGERILSDQGVVTGNNPNVAFDIPAGTTFLSPFYARFRLYSTSTGGTALPTGFGGLGEVEDLVMNGKPTAVTLVDFQARAGNNAQGFWWGGLLLALGALVLGGAAYRQTHRGR